MKFPIWKILALSLFLLGGCGGPDPDPDPPAALLEIEEPLKVTNLWEVDSTPAANQASYRLRPISIDGRIYSIDTSGLIRVVDPENGRVLEEYETSINPIVGLLKLPDNRFTSCCY